MPNSTIKLVDSSTGKKIELKPDTDITVDTLLQLPARTGTMLVQDDLNDMLTALSYGIITGEPTVNTNTLTYYEGSTVDITITNYIPGNQYSIFNTSGLVTTSRAGDIIHVTFLPVRTDTTGTISITCTESGKIQSSQNVIVINNLVIPAVADNMVTWQNGVDTDLNSSASVVETSVAAQGVGETDWVTYQNDVVLAANNVFLSEDATYVNTSIQIPVGTDVAVHTTMGNLNLAKVNDNSSYNTNAFLGYPCEFTHYDNYNNTNLLKTIDPVTYDSTLPNLPTITSSTDIGYADSMSIVTSSRIYRFGGCTRGIYTYNYFTDPIQGWIAAVTNRSFYKELNPDGSIPSTPWVEDTGVSGLPVAMYEAALVQLKDKIYITGGSNIITSQLGTLSTGGLLSYLLSAVIDINGHIGSWVIINNTSPRLSDPSFVVTKGKLYIYGYGNTDGTGWSGSLYSLTNDGYLDALVGSVVAPGFTGQNNYYVHNIFKTKSRVYAVIGDGSEVIINGSANYFLYYSDIDSSGSIGSWIYSGMELVDNNAIYSIKHVNVIVTSNYVYMIIRKPVYYQNHTHSTAVENGHTKIIKFIVDTDGYLTTPTILLDSDNLSLMTSVWTADNKMKTFIINNKLYIFGNTLEKYYSATVDGWDCRLNDNTAGKTAYRFKKALTTPVITDNIDKTYVLPELSTRTGISNDLSAVAYVKDIKASVSYANTDIKVSFTSITPLPSFRYIQNYLTLTLPQTALAAIRNITTYLTKRSM